MRMLTASLVIMLGSAAYAQTEEPATSSDATEEVIEALDGVLERLTDSGFQKSQCQRLLREAEAEVARVLNGLDFTLELAARGKGGLVGNAECQLSSARTVSITYEGATD